MAFGIIWIAAMAIVRYASLREIVFWIFLSTVLFLSIGLVAGGLRDFSALRARLSLFRDYAPKFPRHAMWASYAIRSHGCDMERRRRAVFWAFGLVGFIFLTLSGSRTSLAAAMVALMVYVAAVSSRRSKIAAMLAGSVIVCLFLLAVGAGALANLKSAVLLGRDDPGNVDSLSGRMIIWRDVGDYIGQRPILGYGYGGFWTPTHVSVISEKEDQAIPNSHSTYIEYLVTLGPLGLLTYSLLLFTGIRYAFRAHRVTRNPGLAFCGAFLVFCAVDGFLEVVITEGSPLIFPFIVILAFLAFTPIRLDPAILFLGHSQFATLPGPQGASMNPLVSAVIPTRNRPQLVCRAIDSALIRLTRI